LGEKLFEMAGYSNISATANYLSATGQQLFSCNMASANSNLESDKKIFIPVIINKYRIVGCVDTGSDFNILHESYFKKIFKNKIPDLIKEFSPILSFSDTVLPILGKFLCHVKLGWDHPGFSTNLYIVKDIPNVPIFLLGTDFLKTGLGLVAYSGSPTDPYPEVIFYHPEEYRCEVYHESPNELFTCTAFCTLGPYETQGVEFTLPRAAPVIRSDYILITGQEWDTVSIIPSRSDIEFITPKQQFTALACVVNLSNKPVTCSLRGRYEMINNYDTIPLEPNCRNIIRKALLNHPIGREVLMAKSSAHIHIPVRSVNFLTLATLEKGSPISDLDFADTVMDKEPTYFGEAEIKPEIIEPSGIDLPTIVHASAEEAIDLKIYSPEIQPYIKEIFLNKYPQVVALHSLDAGNLSLTLGFTQLRLREGELLPRSKRIFHVSPSDQRHLDDICEFLIKYGYIMRAPISPNGCHLYGMSAYLVPRSKPNCLGRLIVDFSPVNQLIQSPPAVIPEISATLQFLQGKALYSSIDLKYAYMSLRIDEESRKLTTFLTPTGSFQWLSIPTGAANSPVYFTDACNKILHYEPEYDKNGNLIYEAPNIVKQKRSVLKDVCSYFDDILVTSPIKATYAEILKAHFVTLEKAVKRLAFHGAKISVMKCEFAKSKILFLGWYICHDFVIADPRRIQKVKDFKFPENKKAVRAFLGLVNSLRRVVNLNVIQQIAILSPLTSSRTAFQPTEIHKQAFEQIKFLLTKEPLYGNLIDEQATKYLWVDAATTSGVLGAVLAQKTMGKQDEKIVPDCLDLDDDVHKIIYDKEFPYEPAQLFTSLPITLPKATALKTKPPKIETEKEFLGFTEENLHESFFWSTISILAFYRCQIPSSTLELRKLALKKLKSGILATKLRDFTFKLNYNDYKNYLDDFGQGKAGMDPELYLAEALAAALHRPIIFISSLPKHHEKPVFHFNHESEKPPLIFGIYLRKGKEIFLPFFYNKNVEFKLDHLKGKVQVIAYVAKTVPETFKSRPILDLEVFAILTALYSLQRFISGVKVHLLTDSRVLFYLFSSKVGNSCVKIKRWCLKLISDYPLVTLHFVRTTENLADFLTREGLPPGDLERFNLKNIEISDFYDKLPKVEFTLTEWINFVEDHPEYLTINTPDSQSLKNVALAINKGLDNVKNVVTPLQILKNKLARSLLIQAQKAEFSEIYTLCLAAPDFTLEKDPPKIQNKFKLVSDLLMIYQDFYKIYIPPSMVGILLSYTHLLGHKGIGRMLADMQSYYFENMYTITSKFIQCCYACFLTNKSTRKTKIGIYPTPSYPFEEISMDLAENLNPVNGYANLLIVQCALTDFTIILPLKSKSSNEVTRALMNSVLQQFNVQRLHSDNGPCFRSTIWLETMSAFNIRVIASSALHPSGRGQIERLVGIIKIMLKRMLAINSTLNWEYLPFLCAKIINNSISPKTGFKPQQMVYGQQGTNTCFLEKDSYTPPHYLVKNNLQHIKEITAEIKEMTQVATNKLTQLRLLTNEKLNKNRVNKEFQVNDYVFVLDRLQVPGNSRPLKTKFHPSPYIVIRPLWTTTLVRRLSDGFTTLYSNDDIKKYDKTSPLFANLPKEISRVLLHSFQELINSDLTTITEHDTLDIPQGMQLFDTSESVSDDDFPMNTDDEYNKPHNNIMPDKNKSDFPDIPDEFEPIIMEQNSKEPTVTPTDNQQSEPISENNQPNEKLSQSKLKNYQTEQATLNDNDEDLDEDDKQYINQILVQQTTDQLNDFPKEPNEQNQDHQDDSDSDQDIPQDSDTEQLPRRGTRIRRPKVQFKEY